MEVTVVKLHRETKNALDTLNQGRESYDHIIKRLIAHEKKKTLKKELIEAYKRMDSKEFEEFQEWETASSEV